MHGGYSAYHSLWGVNNTFISAWEFGQTLSRLRGWAWVDIAGCESGDFDRGISSPYRLFTSSSHNEQKSYERPDWDESVWTGLSVDLGMLDNQSNLGHGAPSIQTAVSWAAPRAAQMTAHQAPYGSQYAYLAGGWGTWYLTPPR